MGGKIIKKRNNKQTKKERKPKPKTEHITTKTRTLLNVCNINVIVVLSVSNDYLISLDSKFEIENDNKISKLPISNNICY